ncbi:F-box domain containing protein [Trema orientale]|uniref:F-box domain containing protein n=1 Tax=Trema orientale TaxID=63057 RepID=A0A2P5CB53_TREOI|nr:F-box domain containing protein [Trema orientale]
MSTHEREVVIFIPSDRFLPEEIITDMLVRLDVKSLMRCKCVCKSWRSLISELRFAKLHVQRQPHSLIIPACVHSPFWQGTEFLIYSFENPDEHSTYKFPMTIEKSTESMVVEGCDNGVLCVRALPHNTVYLWNPATNEVKKLPPSPASDQWLHPSIRVGFGYDTLTNDFKVVRVCAQVDTCFFGRYSNVAVYSLRTNSWKKIEMPYKFSSLGASYTYFFTSTISEIPVALNDCVHWLWSFGRSPVYGDVDRDLMSGIVAFDLSTEVFELINLPQHVKEFKVKTIGKVFEQLSFVMLDPHKSIEIYVMKEYGVSDSWIKYSTIKQLECPIPLHEADEYQLINFANLCDIVLIHSSKSTLCYDVEAKEFICSSEDLPVCEYNTYVESIFQIKGEHKTSDQGRRKNIVVRAFRFMLLATRKTIVQRGPFRFMLLALVLLNLLVLRWMAQYI